MADKTEKIEYCEYVLLNNGFSKNDVNYYINGGSENHPQPHGIDAAIWKMACANVGFTRENLEQIGDKFFIKNTIT